MTTTQFFHCCRDLVRVRWTLFVKRAGEIHFLQVVDLANEQYENALTPIVAVAKDRYGCRIRDPHDIHFAAEVLGLSRQNTTLILAASFSDTPPDWRIADVRQDLIAAASERSILIDWFRG